MIHLALLGSLLLGADQDVEAVEVLNLAIGVFALVLLALSLSAYRKTRLNRLIVVSAAFGLFAVEVLMNQLDVFVFAVGYYADRLVSAILDFLILLLFFFAVVRK